MGYKDLVANVRPDADRDQRMMDDARREEAEKEAVFQQENGPEQNEERSEVYGNGDRDVAIEEAVGGELGDMEDVLATDWDAFFADKEMWQYA